MVMEFYNNDNEVWCNNDGVMSRMDEGSPIVQEVLGCIENLYPAADKALKECYNASIMNTTYYNYLRARRFCKCNFGSLDHTREDIDNGQFHLEKIPCPLRGECKYEGVICQPKLYTAFSAAEYRVMKCVYEGLNNNEIAEKLFLSLNTIKRHISTAYTKVGVRSRSEFVKYANDNNIFV